MKINHELIKTLEGLKNDPSLALALYQQLFFGHFWVIIPQSTGDVLDGGFLTYDGAGNIRELPFFTSPERHLLSQLHSQQNDSTIVEVEGKVLWPKMLDIVSRGELEVAVDPGEAHGIRITREMILGMVKLHGN
ncbi:MAG: SseB family protein [Alphaproteobacteria bacterium]